MPNLPTTFYRDNTIINTARELLDHLMPMNLRCQIRHILYQTKSYLDTRKLGMFSNVGIETTTRCNQHCSYCPFAVKDNRKTKQRMATEMSPDLFSKIIDQLAALGFKGKIALQGFGEPLLDPLLEQRIREARTKLPEAYITINTNGRLLTPEKLQALIKAGLSHVYITNHLDGKANAELDQRIKTMQNEPSLRPYISYFSRLTKLRNRGGTCDKALFRDYAQHGLTATPVDRQICISEINTLNISASGNVLVCSDSFVEGKSNVMGNLSRNSIADIWFSDRFRALRRDIRKGIFNCIACRRCNVGENKESTQSSLEKAA